MNNSKPLKRSAFFTNSAAATSAKRPVKRAPFCGTDQEIAARRERLHAQFVNASDDNLFRAIVTDLPEPLRTRLGVSADLTPDSIRNVLAAKVSTLNSDDLTDLWQSIVKSLAAKTHPGNVGLATDTAKVLFSELATACGVNRPQPQAKPAAV